MTFHPPRPWSLDEDNRLVKMRAYGSSYEKIADALGRNPNAVRLRWRILAEERGLTATPRWRPYSDEEDDIIRANWRVGVEGLLPLLPGRTINSIRHRYWTLIPRRDRLSRLDKVFVAPDRGTPLDTPFTTSSGIRAIRLSRDGVSVPYIPSLHT